MTDDEDPPLRDRNRLFAILLNGDPAGYARAEPWRQHRRNARLARKTGPVRPERSSDDSQFQALKRQVGLDRQTKVTCRRLLRSSRAARRLLGHTNRRPAGDEAARQDAKKFVKRIKTMRKHADRVNTWMSSETPFDVPKLNIEFAGGDVDRKMRARRDKEAKGVLEAFEVTAKSILRDVASRKRLFKSKQRAQRHKTS